VRERHRFFQARVGHEDRKFFAAVAADQRGALAGMLLHQSAELPQNIVPRQVAERIVHLLEVVEIEHDERQAAVPALQFVKFFLEADLVETARVQAGEAVGDHAGKKPGIFQGNGQHRAENSELLGLEKSEGVVGGNGDRGQSDHAKRRADERQAQALLFSGRSVFHGQRDLPFDDQRMNRDGFFEHHFFQKRSRNRKRHPGAGRPQV